MPGLADGRLSVDGRGTSRCTPRCQLRFLPWLSLPRRLTAPTMPLCPAHPLHMRIHCSPAPSTAASAQASRQLACHVSMTALPAGFPLPTPPPPPSPLPAQDLWGEAASEMLTVQYRMNSAIMEWSSQVMLRCAALGCLVLLCRRHYKGQAWSLACMHLVCAECARLPARCSAVLMHRACLEGWVRARWLCMRLVGPLQQVCCGCRLASAGFQAGPRGVSRVCTALSCCRSCTEGGWRRTCRWRGTP